MYNSISVRDITYTRCVSAGFVWLAGRIQQQQHTHTHIYIYLYNAYNIHPYIFPRCVRAELLDYAVSFSAAATAGYAALMGTSGRMKRLLYYSTHLYV